MNVVKLDLLFLNSIGSQLPFRISDSIRVLAAFFLHKRYFILASVQLIDTISTDLAGSHCLHSYHHLNVSSERVTGLINKLSSCEDKQINVSVRANE